jgi:tRNA/rRNA methyltransferase
MDETSVAIRILAPSRLLYNDSLSIGLQRDCIDVVLVSPRNPLNIGAVARAMANFGFERLTVVAPYAPHWREARSAVGAPELLENARECATLAEAVAACTLVAGTGSLQHRKPEQCVAALPEFAPLAVEALAAGGRVALVFGPEKHGLTRDDLSYCHLLVAIPTDTRQPSMNLGQAVAVCLYELVREMRSCRGAAVESGSAESEPPRSGEIDRLAEAIEETMTAVGYSPVAMRGANRLDLRQFLRRIAFTGLDAARTLRLFRRILFRLRRTASTHSDGV